MPYAAFDMNACLSALGNEAGEFRFDARSECDSTNTQLMQLAEIGEPTGLVLLADSQTAGRGRRERVWISTHGDSLTFSLLWRFPASSSAPEALSLAVGLALQRGFAALGAKVAVKWPNDILGKGRKLAGVLIETQPGDLKSAVIGIGVNLRMPEGMPVDIANSAIALEELLSSSITPPTRESVLAVLLRHFAITLRRYTAEGFASLRDEWQAQHAFQDREVRISGGSEDLQGMCVGVGERGELLLRTTQGSRRVISGDVSLREA